MVEGHLTQNLRTHFYLKVGDLSTLASEHHLFQICYDTRGVETPENVECIFRGIETGGLSGRWSFAAWSCG